MWHHGWPQPSIPVPGQRTCPCVFEAMQRPNYVIWLIAECDVDFLLWNEILNQIIITFFFFNLKAVVIVSLFLYGHIRWTKKHFSYCMNNFVSRLLSYRPSGTLAGKWRCRTGAAPHPAGPAGWSRWWDDGWGGPGTWAAGPTLSAGNQPRWNSFCPIFLTRRSS